MKEVFSRNGLNWQHLKTYAWAMPTVFTGLCLFLFFIQLIFFIIMPTSYFVKYFRVSPLHQENISTKSIVMVSDRYVRKNTLLRFKDAMYCDSDKNGSYEFISSQGFERFYEKEANGSAEWHYVGYKPEDSDCFVYSTIAPVFWFFEKPSIHIRSDPLTTL